MQPFIDTFKALSDVTRLRILSALAVKELCVCELESVLFESQPKISKHLTKLYDLGLVKRDRRAQFITYSLNHESALLLSIMKVIQEKALSDPQLSADFKALHTPEQWACNLKAAK
jgi:ArsR family transcriptional regulator